MTNAKTLLPNQSTTTLPNGDIQTVSIFEGYPVRTILSMNAGEALVVGKDLGAPLHYADVAQAIRLHVDVRDKGAYSVLPLDNSKRGGGLQQTICVNQSGLNDLLLDSRKPKAKKIRRFLTKEVMPEILNTGEFKKRDKNEMLDTFAEMFSGGATSDQQRKIVEQLAEEQPETTEPHQTPLLTDEATDIDAMFKMAEIAVAGGHNEIYQAIMRRAFKFAKYAQ